MSTINTMGWRDELILLIGKNGVVHKDYPMSKLTTFRIGGPADLYLEIDTLVALEKLITFCRANTIPTFLLGRGANILVRDGGVRGVVFSLRNGDFAEIKRTESSAQILAGSGATMHSVSAFARDHNIAGLEFLDTIPGSLGGGIRMNAGCFNSCLFEVLVDVTFLDVDGAIKKVAANTVPHSYRSCPFFENRIILNATLQGVAEQSVKIDEKISLYRKKRLASQAKGFSAGCVFKNPAGMSAGQLIERAGLKGYSIGGAQVSHIHANFLLNVNSATAQDMLLLIEQVKGIVLQKYGVRLETEILIIGENKNE